MTTEGPYKPEDPANYWGYRYEVGHTDWNTEKVHPLLEKHYNKLNPNGKPMKVLVPLCGMSVDMNWLVNKGMQVIGVDIAYQSLEKFMSLSGQDWTETAVSELGPNAKLFTRTDDKIKLYLGDFMKFSRGLEGTFDFVYDCDGLRVLDSGLTPSFAATIKNLMNPGGRLLLDAIAYDKKILQDENFKPPMPVPPPHSVSVKETKNLFEPECTVEIIDEQPNNLMYGFPSIFYAYLIIKK